MRLKSRLIPREVVTNSIESYEIIEEYPEDKYLPSYLIYAKYGKQIIHTHIAVDREDDNIRIITVYKPTLAKWGSDLKTRRKS
jgi:hypothetical protein